MLLKWSPLDQRGLAGIGAFGDVLAAHADVVGITERDHRPTEVEIEDCFLKAGVSIGNALTGRLIHEKTPLEDEASVLFNRVAPVFLFFFFDEYSSTTFLMAAQVASGEGNTHHPEKNVRMRAEPLASLAMSGEFLVKPSLFLSIPSSNTEKNEAGGTSGL